MKTNESIKLQRDGPDALSDESTQSVKEKNSAQKNSKRMTIQFSDNLMQHIEWLAEVQGISQAEAVRKAVALESYLRQALLSGSKLLIEDEDSVREVIIR
jgi:nucleoid-associated protein YgaU